MIHLMVYKNINDLVFSWPWVAIIQNIHMTKIIFKVSFFFFLWLMRMIKQQSSKSDTY